MSSVSGSDSGHAVRHSFGAHCRHAVQNRFLWLIAKLAVTLGLIGLIARHVDIGAASTLLAKESLIWIAVGAGLILLQISLGALRWGSILDALGIERPAGKIFSATYIGVFFNSCLPGGFGGDIIRMMLGEVGAGGRSAIVHSVIFDRIATLMGVALFIIAGCLLGDGRYATSAPFLGALATALAVSGGPILLLSVASPLAGFRFPIVRLLGNLGVDWHRFVKQPTSMASSLLYSLLATVSLSAAAFAIGRALGTDLRLLDCLFLIPAVALASAIPISIGGWGVRESAMVAALGMVGVDPTSAFLLSVELGIVTIVVSLPGGLLWLRRP